jgi:hypothetical protein
LAFELEALVIICGCYLIRPRGYISIDCKRYLLSHCFKLIFQNITIYDLDENGNRQVCPGLPFGRVDGSHLCHRPFCVNPEHIVFEANTLNLSRNHCFNKFECDGHGKNPRCIFNVDPYIPKIEPLKLDPRAMHVVSKYRLHIAEQRKHGSIENITPLARMQDPIVISDDE